MIKLATVFSGIGAIEHALERMSEPYEIVFACDNGDVDVLSKKVKVDIPSVKESFKEIRELVNDLDVVDEFNEDKNEVKLRFEKLEGSFSSFLEGIDEENFDIDNRKNKSIVREFAQQTGMIYEIINTLRVRSDLSKIKDYDAKKKYVDDLYESKKSSNKVMQSYMSNYAITEDRFHWNVSFIDGKQFENKVDLFVGGSPCQSFSLVGKQRGLEDTRGTLFYEYARLVSEIKPKVFIYENVKAVLSNDNGNTWETMKKVFTDLGYNWKYAILNAKDYGIPQNRERLFVVGFRKDIDLNGEFDFPPEKQELKKFMKDFLVDNVSGKYYLPPKGVAFVTSEKNLTKRYTQIDGEVSLCQKKNQQFNWHGDFVFEEENKDKEKTIEELEKYFLSEKVTKYVMSSGTKNFYSKPQIDLDIARPLLTTMHKMHRAGVDNYVTTDGRIRKLTPRECLRLMGFCDSFKIVVSDTSMYQQAGNSIVVDVLIAILKNIFSVYGLNGDGKDVR